MFTGLVETTGMVRKISQRGNYKILTIASSISKKELPRGASVACDGACLTVVASDTDNFVVEVSQESLNKTIVKNYRVNTLINIERALKIGERLGGHFVSGHIDDIGIVDYIKPIGESLELAIKYNRKYDHLVIEKGSVAVNGISLTINKIKTGWLTVNLIPHTVKNTNIKTLKKRDEVNLEFDMIGKYVAKNINNSKNKITKEKLIESGW
ncbi:MAG: riboflavin synthase [FCB group bacterium]|nr:riboflavin synthase [FCB group bacterium]